MAMIWYNLDNITKINKELIHSPRIEIASKYNIEDDEILRPSATIQRVEKI